MQTNYPKRFSFSGLVELTYKDYDTTIRSRRSINSGYSVLQHKYTLAVKGYIYHPKLATFTSRVTFLYNDLFNSTSFIEPDSRTITYELSAVFLPYRPVSLSTYATVNEFSVDSFGYGRGNPLDNRVVNYGGTLGVNLRNYPTVRLDYYHLDVTPTGSQTNRETTTNNSYYLTVKGIWLKIKTQYVMSFGLIDVHTANTNIQNKTIDLSANTSFRKFSWINYFQYTGQDKLTSYGIYSNLQFNRWQKFSSDYFYSYEHRQNTSPFASTKESVKQELRGSFSYKFNNKLQAALLLNYGTEKDDDAKSNFHTSYRRSPLFNTHKEVLPDIFLPFEESGMMTSGYHTRRTP